MRTSHFTSIVIMASLLPAVGGCVDRDRARAAEESGGEVALADVAVARAQRAHDSAASLATTWSEYGRDYTNQRWSPLTTLDTDNVAGLRLAWVHHSGIPHASETNPVVVDTVMYFTTALNHVFAVDARTGRQLWEYAHDYGGRTVADCCSAINRGVAVYGGRVFMGTVDARLVAIDAATGQLIWSTQVGDNNLGYHITGAPVVVDGRVITGVSGGEQGCRCYVDAYDVNTGKRLWRFYTIPSPAEGGWWGRWRTQDEWGQSFHRDIAREKADSATYADAWQHGGGPMWHHPAYDPELGLLFMNIGNPAPDNDGSVRPGDNLYTDCIVAVDVRTGRLRWYYQEVSHDVWDYDATSPPVLVEVPDSTGRLTKAVAEAGKDGFVYVLDRATGKPLRKSEPYVPLVNYMTPPDTDGQLVAPGTLGGSDWSPAAYSPETGYLYINASHLPMMYWKQTEELRPPAQYWGGTTAAQTTGTYGMVVAMDLATGRVAWQTRLPRPQIGGVLATAGGLVFSGSSDKHVLAFDARTGRELWRWPTDAAVNAPPITYQIDGVQYVAVAATGIQTLNTPRGDEMLAFALPHEGPAGAGLPGVLTPQRDSLTAGATLRASPDKAARRAAPPSGADTTPRMGRPRSSRAGARDTSRGQRP